MIAAVARAFGLKPKPKPKPKLTNISNNNGPIVTTYIAEFMNNLPNNIVTCSKLTQETNLLTYDQSNHLHIACRDDDVKTIQQILEFTKNNKNSMLDFQEDISGNTPLHIAVIKNSVKIVKLLLDAGCNCGLKNNLGLTVLHIACRRKQVKIVSMILEVNNSSVNTQDNEGCSALHIACSTQNIPIVVLLLLQPNIDINIQDIHGYTSLHRATFVKNVRIIELLLRNSVDIGLVDNNKNNVLHHCTTNKIMVMLLDSLFNNVGIDGKSTNKSISHAAKIINSQNDSLNTPLHIACQQNYSFRMVNTLLSTMFKLGKLLHCFKNKFKIHVDHKNKYGDTAFHIACRQACIYSNDDNMVIIVEMLLQAGIDITLVNNYGHTALHIVCAKESSINTSNVKRVAELIINDERCDINSQSNNHLDTPLYIACVYNSVELVKLLINNPKFKINIQNIAKNAPIHIACMWNHVELVQLLLSCNYCDINLTNGFGETPLHIACRKGYGIIAKMLLAKIECDVDAQTTSGNTALHYIIEHCRPDNTDNQRVDMLEIVKLLLETECDVSLKNNLGLTALETANNIKAVETEELIKTCWF